MIQAGWLLSLRIVTKRLRCPAHFRAPHCWASGQMRRKMRLSSSILKFLSDPSVKIEICFFTSDIATVHSRAMHSMQFKICVATTKQTHPVVWNKPSTARKEHPSFTFSRLSYCQLPIGCELFMHIFHPFYVLVKVHINQRIIWPLSTNFGHRHLQRLTD